MGVATPHKDLFAIRKHIACRATLTMLVEATTSATLMNKTLVSSAYAKFDLTIFFMRLNGVQINAVSGVFNAVNHNML